jgi:AmmeMemoRadiSam system protein B/AmmeMemoRadiSam system protein A
VYSGTVAASVYRHLDRQRPRRIVLLGFSHSHAHSGIGVPQIEAYRTPLGEVPVDRFAMTELAAFPPFRSVPEDRLCDHSVEIQLPLLQSAVSDLSTIPLYVGSMNKREREQAATMLARLLDGSTVLIASSDFTHYGRSFGYQPFPVNSSTPKRLEQLDESVMDAASSLEPELFLDEIDRIKATVCGYNPIALLIETMRQAQQRRAPEEEIFQHRLDYQTSGDITGDYAHSVSYGALGYFPATSFYLSEDDQERVLSAARATLDRYIQTGIREPVAPEVTPGLSRPTAAFVTIYRRGELQGCIGRLHDSVPMSAGIPQLTLSAALEDSRFEPIHRGDTSLELEVSVLTPMKRVTSPDQFRVREHGALLESGSHRGLLLPKVAEEHGLNHEQFLAALARKAGTRPEVYGSPDTKLWVFRAQVFGGRGPVQ